MKFLFVTLLYLLSWTSTSSAQQSMISLMEYMSKNNVSDVAVKSYIYKRCASVFLYASLLSPDAKNKTISNQAQQNSELFALLNIKHLTTNGNMSSADAKKNTYDNVERMTKAYGDDGQANFIKIGVYISGYIQDDYNYCNRLIKE